MLKNEKNEQAVSPVIATILMVAITVVLAGVLYVWANNLASEGTDTSASTLNTYTAEDADDAASVGNNDTLILLKMTGKDELAWSFVSITLMVGDNVYTCSVTAGDECDIVQSSGSSASAWEAGEFIFLAEGTADICSAQGCPVDIAVLHAGNTVAGDGAAIVN